MAKSKNIQSKPTPVVEAPAVDNDESKAATIRRVSAELGVTDPKKIVARLKELKVPWCTEKDSDYLIRYTWNLLNRPSGKKRQPEMDLETMLARFEQVKAFAKQHGGREKLLAMITSDRRGGANGGGGRRPGKPLQVRRQGLRFPKKPVRLAPSLAFSHFPVGWSE